MLMLINLISIGCFKLRSILTPIGELKLNHAAYQAELIPITVWCTYQTLDLLKYYDKFLPQFTPVEDLIPTTSFELRRSTNEWWMELRLMSKIITRHDSTYSDSYNDGECN